MCRLTSRRSACKSALRSRPLWPIRPTSRSRYRVSWGETLRDGRNGQAPRQQPSRHPHRFGGRGRDPIGHRSRASLRPPRRDQTGYGSRSWPPSPIPPWWPPEVLSRPRYQASQSGQAPLDTLVEVLSTQGRGGHPRATASRVLDGCAALADAVVRNCPTIRLLVTSRRAAAHRG